MDIRRLRQRLAATKQDHLLQFFDQLTESEKQSLIREIQALDLEEINRLADTCVCGRPDAALPKKITPVTAYPHSADDARRDIYQRAEARGHELLAAGKVAAFLVAGGQGTRLGYDGPKGEFKVTPVRNKSLFQVFAEQLVAHGRRHGKAIPWYIMTSLANDAATRAFLGKHNYFGCEENSVFIFQQGTMPAFSLDGKLLLAEKASLASSPDGHGGSLRALHRGGALADMRRRGVEHLSYFQVDNPLVHCIDPLFLGLHDLTGSEMSSKTIPKCSPTERVGNFVMGDGKLQVIEYSDLPDELAQRTEPDGSPTFNAASIGIHSLRVDFIERLNAGGRLNLPWHRAEKKVPHVNSAGEAVSPQRPNAVKLEQFVFDAIPLARNAILYETTRSEEFSPVKNAEGDDSAQTCRRDQIRRAARWLGEAGVAVPMKAGEPDAVIEISPLFAATVGDLRARRLPTISAGETIYLE